MSFRPAGDVFGKIVARLPVPFQSENESEVPSTPREEREEELEDESL